MLTNQPTDIVTPSSLPLLFLVNFPHGHYNHLGHMAYSRARGNTRSQCVDRGWSARRRTEGHSQSSRCTMRTHLSSCASCLRFHVNQAGDQLLLDVSYTPRVYTQCVHRTNELLMQLATKFERHYYPMPATKRTSCITHMSSHPQQWMIFLENHDMIEAVRIPAFVRCSFNLLYSTLKQFSSVSVFSD